MDNAPLVFDLFSGVGGLSLGAVKAGFQLKGAVEVDKYIVKSHISNFPRTHHLRDDIASYNGKSLLAEFKVKHNELAGIIGGPPCQGFSAIGKKSLDDDRNRLFIHFFEIVSQARPAFFLAENVPGILDPQFEVILKMAKRKVDKTYYLLDPIKVVANEFGAPTSRTRIFFIGVRKDMSGAELIKESIESKKVKKFNYVKDALSGLPLNISDKWIDFDSSWQKVELKSDQYIKDLNEILDGIGDGNAIFRFYKGNEVSGCITTKHSKEIIKRYSKLLPGQQDRVSKSQKLRLDGFCPTLRAGTDSSKGSFQAVRPIHPQQPRVITPREAARLQGFPDWFQFHETKWHSFRQIGNSVCPIVANKILKAIKDSLKL